MPDPFADAELISVYTRADALADGQLIDVSTMAREAGFKIPVAITCGAHADYVRVPPGVQCQDEAGRLWDILWMARNAARRSPGSDRVEFFAHVRNDNRKPRPVKLWAICGPGDNWQPCVTIMRPEDH